MTVETPVLSAECQAVVDRYALSDSLQEGIKSRLDLAEGLGLSTPGLQVVEAMLVLDYIVEDSDLNEVNGNPAFFQDAADALNVFVTGVKDRAESNGIDIKTELATAKVLVNFFLEYGANYDEHGNWMNTSRLTEDTAVDYIVLQKQLDHALTFF